MTFIQISTSVFLLSLFGAQIFPGQKPYASHFGSERGKAIYIIGRFPCMEKLPNFCDCRPGSGLGRVVFMVRGCPRSPPELEAMPDRKPPIGTAAPAIWAPCHERAPPWFLCRPPEEPDPTSWLCQLLTVGSQLLNTCSFT